jgi:SAM-dependent methyltransferase
MARDDNIRHHFKTVSTAWGTRYRGRPRKISDQDLLLRRENVHRLLAPLLAAHATSAPLRVIDVGCGTGDVLDGVGRHLVRVTGVDFVVEMVAAAARTHLDDRFVVGDAARLPLGAASADAVVCLGVLEYLPDPAAVLASIGQTLRPGGTLIVSFPNRLSLFRRLSALEARCERVAIRLRDIVRGGRRASPEGPAYLHAQWSVAGARRLLQAAGFRVDEIMFNTFGLWGRPGKWRPNIAFSERMSRRFFRESPVSAWLAQTMVVRARKPAGEPAGEARDPGRADA